MKKFIGLIIVAVLIFFGVKACQKFMNKDDKWQVKILEPFINVRTEPNVYSYSVARVIQDDKYYVLEVNLDDSKYVWYKINYKGDAYWIASDRETPFVQEYNNPKYGNDPIDYVNPVVTHYEEVYNVKDEKSIEFDHLGIEDEHEFKVTYELFYEPVNEETGNPQYWIRYTIKDSYGNKTLKTQKINFEIAPDINNVKDMTELTGKKEEK